MKYKRVLMFFIGITILLLHTALFSYVWWEFYADRIIVPFYRKGNYLVIALYILMLYIFSRIYGGYRIGYYRISEIVYSQVLALCITNGITYLQISLIGRQFLWFVPILVMTVAQMALVVLWACGANAVYYRLFPPRRMLLVYGSRSAESLAFKMSKRPDKYHICEAVNVDCGYDELTRKISEFEAAVLCDIKAPLRNKLIKFCYSKSIRIYVTPKISDVILRGADTIHLFDTPLLLCRNNGLSVEQRVSKRALDIVVSALVLLLTSPFMLLSAIAIKLYDFGPIFFRQERLTLNGRVFVIYKFRSMVKDAEKDGVARLMCQHDKRVTPVGRVLRKLHIDELPQLFNVLKGDMSLVGPRPERPELQEKYKNRMPEFDYRLKVKAGVTGYAQILGKYCTTPYDKLKLDLSYIQAYSFLLDLKLLLMTVKILFIPESSEGIPDGKVTPLEHENDDKEE